jgi:pimeloyl-ACP methyl ester carboxylesterase
LKRHAADSDVDDARRRCDARVVFGFACAIVFLSGVMSAWGQNAQILQPTPPGTLVDVGGYRVHLNCTGGGSPTVMIVGASFSFDWALVQPEIAKFTRVCTFDPSGTTWSDSFEDAVHALDSKAAPNSRPSCKDRVDEIHRLIWHAHLDGPLVLVGFSAGALWERLYAADYPKNIVGMVIVDHAFLAGAGTKSTNGPAAAKAHAENSSGPVLISQAPMVLGFEDDVNFGKLPEVDQELYRWATAQHPVRPDEAMAEDCIARIRSATDDHAYPLGEMPLKVIRTTNEAPGYAQLQAELLGLSRQSQQVIAWNSSHMAPIDEPEVIVNAVEAVVKTVRMRGADSTRR